MKPTPYIDVNTVIDAIKTGACRIFGNNLIGVYLTGSLSYGDFNPRSSDIDLLVILKNAASKQEMVLIQKLHKTIEQNNNQWASRIECSYIPIAMLHSLKPPKTPRPYIGEGVFYLEALYGNEWLINNYLLYKHGIALIGPDFKTLIHPVSIKEVQRACIVDVINKESN